MRLYGFKVFVLCASYVMSGWAAEVGKRAIVPSDIVDIWLVNEPQISPDARVVAFVVTAPADSNLPNEPRNSDIWIVAADGRSAARKYAFGPAQEIMPRWSPDGAYLAFLSDRGADSRNQIYVMPVSGGEATPLTGMTEGVERFKWEPGSRNITFVSQDSLTTEEKRRRETGYDERIPHDHIKHPRLYRVEFTTKAVTLLTPEDESVGDYDYSPDGSMIAFDVAASPGDDDRYYQSKLVVMDRDGSHKRVLADKSVMNVRWSPDGRQILHFVLTDKSELYFPELVSLSGDRYYPVDKEYVGSIWEAEWLPKKQEFLVSSQEGVQGVIRAVNTKTRKMSTAHTVGRPYWGYANWSISASGKWIAYVDASSNSPMDVWIMKVNGTEAKRLTDFNPQMSSLAFGAMDKIQWDSYDGIEIEGILVKPIDYEPGKPYPLIVQIHGGPAWGWWLGWLNDWYVWAHLLANHGFVVLMPNPRGSACCGWEFAEKNFLDWGGGDFKDIMSGVDYLIKQGIVDSNRLAVGGWSYGGFMTEWAITQTDRFKAAVAVSGFPNLTSMYGTTDIPRGFRWLFDGPPYGREEVYERQSPLTFIKNAKTPILILHGESDIRVPVGQSYEFYQALRDVGVESRFVVYPREGHNIGERAHQIDILERMLDWYKSHVR